MTPQARARDRLRAASFTPLWTGARRALERNGGSVDGAFALGALAPDGAAAVRSLLGRTPARVRLEELDAAVRAAAGVGLVAWLEEVGPPLRDRPGERAARAARRDGTMARLRDHAVAHEPWFDAWVEEARADGALAAAERHGERGYLAAALDVLDLALRGGHDGTSLAALAAAATGDTKALASETVSSLVERALARAAGVARPVTSIERRLLWRRFGIAFDDVSSDVLVLNLRPPAPPAADVGDRLARWLGEAADAGEPFRVTMRQIASSAIVLDAAVVFVCENPSVVMEAATRLGSSCAPLVCTEGVPSDAFWSLLARRAPTTSVLVHADFDAAGCVIAGAVVERAGGEPWRFDAAAYRDALDRHGSVVSLPPSRGVVPPTPWDPALAETLRADGRAVYEELLIDALVADLAPAPRP